MQHLHFFAHIVTLIGTQLPDTGKAIVGADMRPLHGLFWLLGQSPIGLVVAFIGIFAMLFFFKRSPEVWYKAFGYKGNESKAKI